MLKKLLMTASIVTLALFLLPACSKQDSNPETTADKGQATDASAPRALIQKTQDGPVSVMDQPVNFSSQDEVNKSIDLVRQQAGDKKATELNSAMGIMLAQDMSLRQDKNILFRKLDGKTPNEIIAMGKR